jgi:hypothetical protein
LPFFFPLPVRAMEQERGCWAGHKDACVSHVDGVGWVLDPNLEWHANRPTFEPRPAFHLPAPYIKALASSEDAEDMRSRKRRRKWAQHQDATDANVVEKLGSAHQALMGSCCHFFSVPESGKPRECCSLTQVPVDTAPIPSLWPGNSHSESEPPLVLDPATGDSTCENEEKDLEGGRLVIVLPGMRHVRLVLSGEVYLVPPNSTFYLGDAAHGLSRLHHQRFHLIIIDPPWPSKSRGKHYKSMTVGEMCALPMRQLLLPCGLLAMWVTNNHKLVHAAQTEILAAWGLELVAEWYWLKVTCAGHLCSPLESPHKKPFERLMLARVAHTCTQPAPCCDSSEGGAERGSARVPDGQVMVWQPRFSSCFACCFSSCLLAASLAAAARETDR